MQQKLAKGIVLGGLCSVISLDISEVIFEGLNPLVKKLHKAIPAVSGGASVGRPPMLVAASSSVTAADLSAKIDHGALSHQMAKEKKKKKARKLLYKRILRILLLMGVAYFVVAHLMQS